MKSWEQPITLYRRKGNTDDPWGFIQKQYQPSKPLLSWIEPRPALAPDDSVGRHPGYQWLYTGIPPSLGTLAEARLFWKTHSLHLVVTGATGRWAEFSEEPPPDGEQNAWEPVKVHRQLYKVVLRRDGETRFSLLPTLQSRGLYQVHLIEYWCSGAKLAWRLVPRETGRALVMQGERP